MAQTEETGKAIASVAPGILGTKLGMTQVYDEAGVLHSVTVVKAGPCVVLQRKDLARDGYVSVQLGLVDERKLNKRVTKALQGHLKKANAAGIRTIREFRLRDEDASPGLTAGQQVMASDFAAGDLLDAIGTSKGKGFQGAMKRHNFSGGAASHGSMFHRAPGSIGASAFPSRVFAGTRMPGHMGAARVTVKNLPVVRVDAENHLIFLGGAVPGGKNGVVMLRPSKKGKRGGN